MKLHSWPEGQAQSCAHFQLDLSCMVDGELDEAKASRAMGHIEQCEGCRGFFEDVRVQVRLHNDLAQPDNLIARFGELARSRAGDPLDAEELADKLANVFYQIGKAYVLQATQPGHRQRVFEAPVNIEPTQVRGRGFVDGVIESGRGQRTPLDWRHARGMLNGKLTRIEGALEKGRRLLEECLAVCEDHEEARIYLAFIAQHEGKTLRAEKEFRRVFRSALSETNRGHAAAQLALLYAGQEDYRKAIACLRWVTSTGLDELEPRFFFVRFNIGMYYAHLRDPKRALAAFRGLLDRHPERAGEVAELLSRSPMLRALIEAQAGFAEGLFTSCPELFQTPRAGEEGSAHGGLQS